MEDRKYPAEVDRWLDDLYELFCDWKSKGGKYAMTCPNCGEEMEYTKTQASGNAPNATIQNKEIKKKLRRTKTWNSK